MKTSKLKVVRAITDLSPNCYRLSTDGRKWKTLCDARQRLATWLALKADPDGTRIYPGIQKMMEVTKWSHGKTCYVLDDLREIGCIISEGKLVRRGQVAEHGTSLRRFDPTPLLNAHAAIKRNEPFIHLDTRQSKSQAGRPRKSEIHDSKPVVQDSQQAEIQDSKPEIQLTEQESKIQDQESNAGLDATALPDRPNIPTTPTEGKTSGAVVYFSKCYGRVMGEPFPIPLTEEEKNKNQSLEDTYGKKLYRKVCRYWTQKRDLVGMKYVGQFFLKEFDDYLSMVQAQGKPDPEVQAAIEADRAARLLELDREREQIQLEKEFLAATIGMV